MRAASLSSKSLVRRTTGRASKNGFIRRKTSRFVAPICRGEVVWLFRTSRYTLSRGRVSLWVGLQCVCCFFVIAFFVFDVKWRKNIFWTLKLALQPSGPHRDKPLYTSDRQLSQCRPRGSAAAASLPRVEVKLKWVRGAFWNYQLKSAQRNSLTHSPHSVETNSADL